jgi:hypothetical protein
VTDQEIPVSHQRRALLLAASIPLAFVVGSVSPTGEVGLLAALAVFVWVARSAPGFAGAAVRGLVAGAVAGLLVLGVGFRLAMRVVAVTDPARTPEFSFGGTAFILIGIGLMLGGSAGAYLGGLRHLLGLGRAAIAILATVALVPTLFGDSEIRAELFELGLGAWLNIPMFTSIVFAFGLAQYGMAGRLDRWTSRRRAESDVTEPAPVP